LLKLGVVMYNYPLNVIDYMQRVGRVGRLGRGVGRSTALVYSTDLPQAKVLLNAGLQRISVAEAEAEASKPRHQFLPSVRKRPVKGSHARALKLKRLRASKGFQQRVAREDRRDAKRRAQPKPKARPMRIKVD